MGGDWITLAAATAGVLGTLGAALLTQRRADQTKRMELQALAASQREERRHTERVRRAEHAEAAHRELLALRRACYIAFNTAARQYQTAQVNLLHALRSGTEVDACREQLETQRLAHRDSYAEAEMILPAAVFSVAREANQQLNASYGRLKQIEGQLETRERELDDFDVDIEVSWALLSGLRHAMRHDLGVDQASL
ncbi:hypothetical protein [Streptomyces sp. NPDC055189]